MSDEKKPNPKAVEDILLRFFEWRAMGQQGACPLSEEDVQALGEKRIEAFYPLREVVVVEEGVVLA